MFDWAPQRYWDEVRAGDEIPPVEFPLTVHRLVVEAGANRDFSAIHHNADHARGQGAPDMYANNVFALGMWERTVRQFIGLDGVIKRLGPFRLTKFATPGETVVVHGTVTRKWADGGEHYLALDLRSTTSIGDCVVGSVTVTLPARTPSPEGNPR